MRRRDFLATPLLALAPATARDEIRKALGDIIKFWYPRSIDKAGGYMVDFDAQGQPLAGRRKMIVTQARMLWFFARLAHAGVGNKKEMLAAADHGWRHLTSKMWDDKRGGFYWEVERPDKHLYGQSFGLYALSEFATASERTEVLDFAGHLFDLLESHAHDAKNGGYRESFHADWTPAAAGSISPMGLPSELKLMNTHLHLMEAMSAYVRASGRPVARDRLIELITIQSNAVIRKRLTAGTDQYAQDWTPVLKGAKVSYGHDLENVWLLKDACDAAGLPFAPFVDLCRELWRYARAYGWDDQRGGVFSSGPFNQPADDRRKSWWVQAETLVSALTMWRVTGEQDYYRRFERTWDFVKRYQIDAAHGEWHEFVLPDGRGIGNKGSAWKAAYHNGRSMLECDRLLG